MSAQPTERELELGLDLGTDVYGEGQLGAKLGQRIAELLAERREHACAELEYLQRLIQPSDSYWNGYIEGLGAAVEVVKRAGRE